MTLAFNIDMIRLLAAILLVWLQLMEPLSAQTTATRRSLVTDEPRRSVGKPEGAPDYVARVSPSDGQHLRQTVDKLKNGLDPARPFSIWALGSSYTNMLGNGEAWKEQIPRLFPNAPSIEYQKMVGNSCPWQYVRGWARHLGRLGSAGFGVDLHAW